MSQGDIFGNATIITLTSAFRGWIFSVVSNPHRRLLVQQPEQSRRAKGQKCGERSRDYIPSVSNTCVNSN